MQKLTQTEALAKLNPPRYNFTVEEENLAQINVVYDEVLFTMLYHMSNAVTSGNIDDRALEAAADFKRMSDAEDDDYWWLSYLDIDRFDKYIKGSLDTPHEGDCTAMANSCSRCYAESIFRIPNTANWGKHEGHEIYCTAYPEYFKMIREFNNPPLYKKIWRAIKFKFKK